MSYQQQHQHQHHHHYQQQLFATKQVVHPPMNPVSPPPLEDECGSSPCSNGPPPNNSLMEMICRFNNLGCACLVERSNAQDFSQAGVYLGRALEMAQLLVPISSTPSFLPHFIHEAAEINSTASTPPPTGSSTPMSSNNNSGSEFYVSKSLYVYQRGEYDEGMHGYSDPITLEFASSNMNAVATLYFNLGQLYLRINKDEKAQDCFLAAMQLLGGTLVGGKQPQQPWGEGGDKCPWKDHTLDLVSSSTTSCTTKDHHHPHANGNGGVRLMTVLHNVGHVQYRNGHYEDAIQTYQKALEICQTSAANDSSSRHILELASTLNCLGVCHFHLQQADTDKALSYYCEALTIRQQALLASKGQHPQPSTTGIITIPNASSLLSKEIATIINNIGRVYFMLSQYDMALEYYNQSLLMRRSLFGNDHLDVGATIFNAGQTFHHLGQYDKAMELYQEFLAIAKKHLGYHHRDVACMLKCMAQIKHECNHVAEAKELYQEAIQVGRASLGQFHPEIASTLNKLGNLLYESGDFDNAIQVYRQGLEVERTVLEPDHPNITVTITNIAQIYKLQEQYDLALNLYKECVAIYKRSLDASHPSISGTLSCIALIYYRTRRFTKALEVYQEALRLRREAYGDHHLEVASTLNSVGLVLYKMDLHDYALQSFHESLKIRRDLLGPDHREVAVVLYNLATCCLECGEEERAMTYYRETLCVEKKALGDDHPDVIMTLLHCGQVLQGRGELNEAMDYYVEALQAAESRQRTQPSAVDHATMANLWNHLGNVFLQRGEALELVDALSNALRHFRLAGKAENELVLSGFSFYALAKNHPECAPVA